MKNNIFLIVISLLSFISCQRDPSLEIAESEKEIKFYVPQGFPPAHYQFTNNPITQKGFELGRSLFYDPILSKDNTISCGSCHQLHAAFAHSDHALSHGINGLFGNRNSPALFNTAWWTSFFWDGGVNHIEVQPIAPITNPVEMDETLANVIAKLQAHPNYPSRFNQAFGSDSITSQNMLRALAQFMGAMISADSKYDKYIRQENGVTLTNAELNGMNIFNAKCATCHTPPLFTDFSFRNNGLYATFPVDSGRARITGDVNDIGKFKVPSLRNIVVTKPYMHDGSINQLADVLEHYNSGIQSSATLDPLLSSGISLSNQEKSDLLSFLATLTDYTFINDQRFAEQ
ncbi:MAG TPA: cytochrome c peroxidase [Bacteroidia bacterium]|nr:cytochrome c peroxidase [Bacteroidia bacterium]